MKCKILKHYPNADGWLVGDVVEITNPDALIEQGLVEEYVEKKVEPKAEPKKSTKKAKK